MPKKHMMYAIVFIEAQTNYGAIQSKNITYTTRPIITTDISAIN